MISLQAYTLVTGGIGGGETAHALTSHTPCTNPVIQGVETHGIPHIVISWPSYVEKQLALRGGSPILQVAPMGQAIPGSVTEAWSTSTGRPTKLS